MNSEKALEAKALESNFFSLSSSTSFKKDESGFD